VPAPQPPGALHAPSAPRPACTSQRLPSPRPPLTPAPLGRHGSRRIPATWQGIQAAKQLEAEGIATQLFMIFSFAQGVAAAQAGASVVQVNVGRTRDW
jgi:hypothetical protein